MNDPILICGAGPTGLVLAIHLARSGVSFRLIEKRTEIDPRSKALSMNSATLELFEDLGVADRLLDEASIHRDIHLHWRGQRLWKVDLRGLSSRFPFFAMLPQPRTERVLRDRLAELGGRVETGSELVDLVDRGDSVQARIRHIGSGQVEDGRFAYVLGCDGSRSAVRRLAGVAFEGFDYPMSFAMCDAPVRWPGQEGKWHYFVDEDRFFILIPLTSELHRLVVKDRSERPSDADWRREDFQRFTSGLAPDLRVGKPVWTSTARFYNRLAERFRCGRIFLLGDAAHLFSPIGGQGMNTGVQDAYNLAWRLTASRELADDGLLDGYETERKAFAEGIQASTDGMTRVIARLDKDPEGPLGNFLPTARGREFIRHRLPNLLSGSTASYGSPRAADLAGGVGPWRVGERVRSLDPGLDLPSLHDPTGRRLRLSYFPGRRDARVGRHLRRLAEELRPWVEVRRLSAASARRWGIAEGEFAIVRPDRFLVYRGRAGRAEDRRSARRTVRSLFGALPTPKGVAAAPEAAA